MTDWRGGGAMRVGSGLAALAGLTLMVVLVAYQGLPELGQALASAGWGIAVVTAVHLVPLAASATAWRVATRSAWRGSAAQFLWARLVREAVNGLLPVAQIGGDLVGARVLTFHGAPPSIAGASVLVDLTLEFLTQIVFTAIGVGLALHYGGGIVGNWTLFGLAAAIIAAAGFLLAQRWGLFKLVERLLERLASLLGWPGLRSLDNLHEHILALYRDRAAIVAANLWHLLAWILGAAEVWLTLHFLGAEATFLEALVIESLGQAIRTAAFLVPGAFGIQEGGYLLLGVAFGVGPEAALSVSLIKRIRELALGLPAMLAWQAVEGRHLLKGTGSGSRDGS